MELIVVRSPQGFTPASTGDWEKCAKIKTGTHMRFTATQMRNVMFHRRYFALLNLLYDHWCELTPSMEYKGIDVLPEFDRFRKDVAILAGFYRPVFNVRNEVRLEAESISFANMDEERFAKLYSATIDVGLNKILPKGMYSEETLRAAVELLLGFAS